MKTELHVRLHPEAVVDPEDLLPEFPLEPGQTIISYLAGTIVIDLGDAGDTTYVQDWFLNSSEDVISFYVVED